jgi:hypothetical protein
MLAAEIQHAPLRDRGGRLADDVFQRTLAQDQGVRLAAKRSLLVVSVLIAVAITTHR